MYFSGQGKVLIASRDANGNPLAFRHVGNVPELKISLKVETMEHQETVSGQRLTDLRLTKSKAAEFSCTLEDFTKENLQLVLYGASSEITSGTVSSETLVDDLVVGDRVALAHQDVSSVVITDSDTPPSTLVAGTDYEVDQKFGTVRILNLGSYVQPFKAAYSYGAVTHINMLTQALPERWMRFEGLNTAYENAPVLIELYRVSVDPLKELSLIGDDLMKFELSGSALYDATKISDATLGQFGRIVMI